MIFEVVFDDIYHFSTLLDTFRRIQLVPKSHLCQHFCHQVMTWDFFWDFLAVREALYELLTMGGFIARISVPVFLTWVRALLYHIKPPV